MRPPMWMPLVLEMCSSTSQLALFELPPVYLGVRSRAGCAARRACPNLKQAVSSPGALG